MFERPTELREALLIAQRDTPLDAIKTDLDGLMTEDLRSPTFKFFGLGLDDREAGPLTFDVNADGGVVADDVYQWRGLDRRGPIPDIDDL